MSKLALRLLGAPEITRDGEPVGGFRSNKARALLFYVAVSGRSNSRARLAALLWGDLPQENADANLRKTLTNLRRIAAPHLTITRYSVALNDENPLRLDVREFEAAFETTLAGDDPDAIKSAVALYRGDFLDGFYVRQAPEFEAWQLAERYRLREQMAVALQALAEQEAEQGHYAAAIAHAQRLLEMEPLREDVHRLLMALFAQNGQRAQALAQYERVTHVLAEELAVEPGEKTAALFEEIRDSRFVTPALHHNLPAPTTSFVGRDPEMARFRAWLQDDAARLLTITGPGGAGKSRLAEEAARGAVGAFAGGVWLVPLAALEDVADVATALATTLQIKLSGRATPEEQVTRSLRRKNALLILDNAEHLVSQALARFLQALLTGCPALQIVVTSRQRLEMQAERVLTLPGLAFPDAPATVAGLSYPARQLFRQRAAAHGRPLPETAEVDEAILLLCRLTDGLPLALELAATWTPVIPLAEIVSGIEGGLDMLATRMHDILVRHRTIQTVFDTTWELLSEKERQIMQRLAYFRGRFSLDAAAAVAQARPGHLRALVNKSLVRARQGGHYDIHELIRHYAVAKLSAQPGEEEEVALHHGRYYAAFLAEREEAIQGQDYLLASAEIEREVDNVRKAWEWMVTTGSLEELANSAETLHYYFMNTQSLFDEAARRFEQAARALTANRGEEVGPLVGRLYLKAAVNRRMLAQLDEAARLAEESLHHARRQELAPDVTRATSTLSVIRMQQNDNETAPRLANSAVALARELDDDVNLCLCLNNLAYVLASTGKTQEAIESIEESLALARMIDFPHGELSALNMLSVYLMWQGQAAAAEEILEQLVARCRQSVTKSRLAQAVNNLGLVYKLRGALQRAQPLLEEAVQLYEEVGQVHYAALTTMLLGELALEDGREEDAWRQLREALQTAQELEMQSLDLTGLQIYGQLLQAGGKRDEAIAVLTLVINHPATAKDTREATRKKLLALREATPPQAFATAEGAGSALEPEDVVAEALTAAMSFL